uniref:ATP synthase complex subunit 8 n=1 Tax=Ochthebius remotus TaxID=1309317 RepID=A0A7H0DJZ2_9COLE|nr:ATP synthase F0 subunit 8 [Ochthebius remotus]QNP09652.1 ATP synthase F0 subunit 8 [Ochthebius remotus]
MPQMAPLNWIMLFFMFTMIFMLFNSMNYFSFKYKNIKFNTIKKNLKTNWKW